MRFYITSIAILIATLSFAQTEDAVNYALQKEYEIGGVIVSGTKYLDENVIVTLSKLSVGDKITIPGEQISNSIRNLWKQGLFADVEIHATHYIDDVVFLEIKLQERPRLCSFSILGVKKQEKDDIRESIRLIRGKVITENVKNNATNIIRKIYTDKGFLNTQVDISEQADSATPNCIRLKIQVNKGNKIKINEITFSGYTHVKEKKLKRLLKNTKERGTFKILTSSKFQKADYEDDKINIIDHYNTKGYRDAKIKWDTVRVQTDGNLSIQIEIDEGNKYYFGDIIWNGNAKFTNKKLTETLGIKKGDIYDNSLMENRLYMNTVGQDISSLYMDDGYLFFQANPVEIAVDNDTIDIEIRIYEGPQATINEVTIVGNTKTNEHVIRRELRTKPGNKFSRSDIIRSQREIASLGYFDPESLGVNPMPHPESGTVDIEYTVAEKPADQVEMSMGWGGIGLVGSFGVSFTNFSVRNIFKKDSWAPLPAGDGQRLSVRASANAKFFRSINMSFTEPWIGGKKPNSFTVSIYRSVQSNGVSDKDATAALPRSQLATNGGSIGLGIRLAWPDDYFTLYSALNFQNFDLENWFSNSFIIQDGVSNNFSFSETLARNSLDQPLYPRHGSNISLTVKVTPPYSLFNRDKFRNPDISSQEKYKWVEYHKWRINADWYTKLVGDLVLKTSAKFGFLGFYNRNIGQSPFERYQVGGNGLTNFALYGVDVISSRGYDTQDLLGIAGNPKTIFNKTTIELRFPISLNPMSTIYVLGFVEGVNVWDRFKDFNPYDLKRSAGFGLRVFLPMFGLLGFDYGIGFDSTKFKTAESFGEKLGAGQLNIILGIEPD